MRNLVICVVVLACGACGGAGVEPAVVGTWELQVPNPSGVSHWEWDVRADGTYYFHADGPGSPPAHSGTFRASNGHYRLVSTTIAWNDEGTYQLADKDTMVATGRIGTGSWHRVPIAAAPDVPQPATAPQPAPLTSSLSKHFSVDTFWEKGDANDHAHRSNIDGTIFEHDTRTIAFSAKSDLPKAQLPPLRDINCAVSSAGTSRALDLFWMETSTELSLIGSVKPPPGGQWPAGGYTFTCAAPDGMFISRAFTIE